MSRIGKNPVGIPDNVTVTLDGDVVNVKGPKGELSQQIRPEIAVKVEDNTVSFEMTGKQTKQSSAFWGLYRALVANMVKGVTDGFEKKLELVGVGYRARKAGNGLTITVGYSHPVEVSTPEGIEFDVPDEKTIIIKGIDKQLVGLVAAKIRAHRIPEPYKGKGIRYSDEYVRRKAGKTGKV